MKFASHWAVELDVAVYAQELIAAKLDEFRIDKIHSGVIEVIKSEKELIINKNNIDDYPGTKPGANLPIINQDKLVGVVGVSGEPDKIVQLTGLIRVSVEIIMEQLCIQRLAYFNRF